MSVFVDGSTHAFNSRIHDKRSAASQPIDDFFEEIDAQRLVFVGETFDLKYV